METQKKFNKGEGLTVAEKYLGVLCEKTFLSLWSYPNVFRQPGKELCDLLVVFGNDIIIFSDKQCAFPQSDNLEKDWERWFKRAVSHSCNQLSGAERWIREHSDRIFLDNKCIQPIPFPIKMSTDTKIHLLLVAHGASEACKKFLGGSGSMMYQSSIKGLENHKVPFAIGDLNANKTFVHVLDDTTLDILMMERDTIADFTTYLIKREALLRSEMEVFSSGEEELLSVYLKNLNDVGEHDFVLPKKKQGQKINGLALMEGFWEAFQKNPQRIARKEADKISYSWDKIIEKFAHHAVHDTQYKKSTHGLSGTEASLRIIASESRFMRRILSTAIHDMLQKTPENQRMIRIVPSDSMDGLHYVFLVFPFRKDHSGTSYDEYRTGRQYFLQASCMVARLINPEMKHIIGFATETGIRDPNRSEDLLYFDCINWTHELEEQAKKDQIDLNILTHTSKFNFHATEYPDIKPEKQPKKVQRNDPCPCDSGLKYKKCHGR